MPVYFVSPAQVHNGLVTIAAPLVTHLRDSLRVKVGEQIWLGDGQRRRYLIETTRMDRATLQGRVLEERTGPAPVWPAITLAPALLKGDRMDWLIQKATELGAAAIMPLITRQTIVRPKAARVPVQETRWQRIALEAAQQSERWDIPTVTAPHDTAEFFQEHPAGALKLILSERASGERLIAVTLPQSRPGSRIVLAVGPEGGWAEEEMALATKSGFIPVTLGGRILRAETAAVAALSILQSRLGELG
jgi:16S rRNA (uracil1498-N3)-methyltransferase